MQTLFALGQCKEANFNIGLAEIEEAFQPDLNSMEPQDKVQLKAESKKAKSLFNHKVNGARLNDSEPFSKQVEEVAGLAYKNYLDNSKKDLERLRKDMLLDAESLIDYFLWTISLMITWSDLSKTEADKKQKLSPERLLSGDFNLAQNKVVNYLRKSSKLQVALVKKNISWEDEEDNFKNWYKEVVKKDETFSAYRRNPNPGFADDKEYSEMIAAKTKNWEVDRLANTDQIILKMAIAEMLNFRNIPVKVTINEYIELSKNYSTPKSKQFVNGILDVISNELKENGILKKTGRGLIDNK